MQKYVQTRVPKRHRCTIDKKKLQVPYTYFSTADSGPSNFILLMDPLQNVTQSAVHAACTGTVHFSTAVCSRSPVCVSNVAHPESLVLDPTFKTILNLNPDVAPTFNPWIK